MNENNGQGNGDNRGWWKTGALATGVAALAGGIYWYTRGSTGTQLSSSSGTSSRVSTSPNSNSVGNTHTKSTSQYLVDILSKISNIMPRSNYFPRQIPRPIITNLDSLLADIYVRYVKLQKEDFRLHYKVFDTIFQELHKKMKQVDPYYNKYSSTVQFAGSHYDNLRIKRPDEFDMDIVIGLPLSIKPNILNHSDSDFILEPKHAGFLHLRMGVQYQRLPMRDGAEWLVNKTAFEWKDNSNYLLHTKFLDWFKSVVNRALNEFQSDGTNAMYYVEGVPFTIRKSASGPAMTLIMENKMRNFRLDVDLVPALKFPEGRWPIGQMYRQIPGNCRRGFWTVVGKPDKSAPNVPELNRSWRIALHIQERELMHDSYNLRQALRLIKKLRDTLEMKKIASYYVKTLFFWEIINTDARFWSSNSPAFLFKLMVGKLLAALVDGNIPYFWNRRNNLIWNVNRNVLNEYVAKLRPLMVILEQKDRYKEVARFLLTPDELRDYNANILNI